MSDGLDGVRVVWWRTSGSTGGGCGDLERREMRRFLARSAVIG